MKLHEAMESGKSFRRAVWAGGKHQDPTLTWLTGTASHSYSTEDVRADDWYLKEEEKIVFMTNTLFRQPIFKRGEIHILGSDCYSKDVGPYKYGEMYGEGIFVGWHNFSGWVKE